MATCAVSGTLKDLSETAISGAIIRAVPSNPSESGTTVILDKEVSTTSASDGTWTLSLLRGAACVIEIEYSDGGSGKKRRSYPVTVTDAATAEFTTLVSL
jgi:hypothetical protein